MSKGQESEESLPERWSAKAKSEVVLRLLRGEGVEAVSRKIQVAAHELETWRKDFQERGCGRTCIKKLGSGSCPWIHP